MLISFPQAGCISSSEYSQQVEGTIRRTFRVELGSTGVVISQPGLCGNDDTGVFLDVVIYRLPSTNAEMVITKIEDFEHGDGVQGGRNITTLFTGGSWFEGQAEILTLGTEDDLDVDDPVSGSATTSVAVVGIQEIINLLHEIALQIFNISVIIISFRLSCQ